MSISNENISKQISYWLRHNPGEVNLHADEFGWINIDQLLIALNSKNTPFDLQQIINLNNSFDKVRWEIDVSLNRIRATHGHSIQVLLEDKTSTPPEVLYHGTAIINLNSILDAGLLKMDRNFVHLSETIEQAISIGKRHGKPFVIEIDAAQLIKDGWTFYHTGENVWLTSNIPAKYLSFEPWYKEEDSRKDYFLKELKREIGDRTKHILFSQLGDLETVWNTGRNDDVLFANKKTGIHYLVHLTYTRQYQEIDGFPFIAVYNTFEEWLENKLWEDQQDYYDLNYKS